MNNWPLRLSRPIVAAMLALTGQLATAEVSVVKIVNFSCPYCRSSEGMDEPIRQAVVASGGKLVYAALPADENSDSSRELTYYAARGLMPDKEPQIRASLYKGAQDLGYPLATVEQTVEWLNTDLAELKTDWTKVTQAAGERSAKDAYRRAIDITIKSGAQVLPTYVVLVDGTLVKTLDVDSAGGTYPALREAILNAIEKATTAPKTTK